MTPLGDPSDAEAISETLERAQKLVARGRIRRALVLLERAVHRQPGATELRLALAERYRALDHRDQAGRWGIIIDGWTTPLEKDRLARLLASSPAARADLPGFLALPAGAEDHPELQELMNGPVRTYVELYEAEPPLVATGERRRLLRKAMFWRR